MDVLQRFDAYLLKHFQEYSEHKQVTTDKNCYYFAAEAIAFERLFAYVFPAIFLIMLTVMLQDFLQGFLAAFVIVIGSRRHLRERRFWHRVRRQQKKLPEPPQPFRIIMVMHSIAWTPLNLWVMAIVGEQLLFAAVFGSMLLGWYMMTIAYYFLSCSPLPPETLEFRRSARRKSAPRRSFRPQAV